MAIKYTLAIMVRDLMTILSWHDHENLHKFWDFALGVAMKIHMDFHGYVSINVSCGGEPW